MAALDASLTQGYWYMTHSTYVRNDQLGCVVLYLSAKNGDGKIEGVVTSKYLYVWWAQWYFNGDKIQVKQLDIFWQWKQYYGRNWT